MVPNKITVHSAATKPSMDIGAAEIRDWHINGNGWSDIGYHAVIRRNGVVEWGRPESRMGAHVGGHNDGNLGVCLVGGMTEDGSGSENNFTTEQMASMKHLILEWIGRYGIHENQIRGHRDFSPDKNRDGVITKDEWVKTCPCFSVRDWWSEVTA